MSLESTELDVNVFFLFWATTLVFIMQGGFMLLEVGSVSIRNTKNILFKNGFDVCISTACFYLWGYAFAYGDDKGGLIGFSDFALAKMEEERDDDDAEVQDVPWVAGGRRTCHYRRARGR